MKCEVCGIEYKDTDRFCGMCGTPNPLFEVKSVPEGSPSVPSGAETVQEASEAFDAAETSEAAGAFDTAGASGISADSTEAAPIGREEAYSFPDPTKSPSDSIPNGADPVSGFSSGISSEAAYETVSGTISDTVSEAGSETAHGDSAEIASEAVSGTVSEPVIIAGTKGEPDISGETENAEAEDRSEIAPEAAQASEPVKSAPAAEPTEDKQPFESPADRSFAAPAAMPTGQPNPAAKAKQKNPKPKKEKRVCSLSAVVICIVIILILSVACGALSGLYLGEKAKVRKMRQGSIVAPYSYSEFHGGKQTPKNIF